MRKQEKAGEKSNSRGFSAVGTSEMEKPHVLEGFNILKIEDFRELKMEEFAHYLLVTGSHQQAVAYFPGTTSMGVLALASRSQVHVANIRWLSEELSGMRARQASKVSPCVPVDTRVGPVFTALTLPLEVGEAGLAVPSVAAVFVPAQPIVKVARPKEAHRNNLEDSFIGQAPPQWINKFANILEYPQKNKMG